MKIIYWSDFNCPYSYIGLNRLTQAIEELDLEFEWEIKAFELEKMASNVPTQSMTVRHAIKFGLSEKDAIKKIEDIEKIAKSEGLNLNYKGTQLTSSRNAHRLIKYIENKHPELLQEIVFKIYEANFVENRIIADVNVLASLVKDYGLENEVQKILSSDSYDIEVDLDEEDAGFNGICSVPHYIMIVNGEQLIIPGAFEKEDFKIAIEDMISGKLREKSFL